MEVMAGTVDRELAGTVASAAAGDHAAFGRIVAAYHEDMVRVCGFVARDEELAHDAVQTAWSIAWRKLDTLREPERLRPWLMRMALNEAKKLLKKRNRRLDVEVAADTSRIPGGIDPATGIDSLDMLAAVDRLEPEERALLGMRYVAGFDSTELASALGLSASGTRTRIERLLGRLRKELE